MVVGRRFLWGCCALALVGSMAMAQSQPAAEEPTDVEGLVVTAPIVPVPKVGDGAPLYTPDELKAMADQSSEAGRELQRQGFRCATNRSMEMFFDIMADRSRTLAVLANRAYEATLAAEEIRRAAAQGKATQQDVAAAELARQDAVNKMINLPRATSGDSAYGARIAPVSRNARNPDGNQAVGPATNELDKMLEAAQGGLGQRVVPKSVQDLALVDTFADFTEDFQHLVVIGAVHNTRNREINFPPLTFTVVDRNGSPLKTVVAETHGRARLKSGERRSFTYEIRDAPELAAGVNVTLGGGSPLVMNEASLTALDCNGGAQPEPDTSEPVP